MFSASRHCSGTFLRAVNGLKRNLFLQNIGGFVIFNFKRLNLIRTLFLLLYRSWSWQATHRRIWKWNVSRRATYSSPFAETRSWTAWSRQPLPAAVSFRTYTSRWSARKRTQYRTRSARATSSCRRPTRPTRFWTHAKVILNSEFSRDPLTNRRVVITSVRQQHTLLIYNVIHKYVILASPNTHKHITYKQKNTHKSVFTPARIHGEGVEYETKTKT